MSSLTRLVEHNLRHASGVRNIKFFSSQASPAGNEANVEDEG